MSNTLEEITRKAAAEPQYRSFAIDTRETPVDEEARTVKLAYASDKPCGHWMGDLQLSMDKRHVRTGRLESGAPLLMDHNTRDQIGVVESYSFDADGVARATVRFSESARASEVFRDVATGIRKCVSVGFLIHSLELVKSEDDKPDLYRCEDWEPLEISIVATPADISVGVGRSIEEKAVEQAKQVSKDSQQRAITNNSQEITMSKEIDTPDAPAAVETRSAAAIEAQRTKEIIEFADIFGAGELAREMLAASDKVTLEDVRTAIRDGRRESTKVPTPKPEEKAAAENREIPARVESRASLGERFVSNDAYKNLMKRTGKKQVSLSIESDLNRATFSGSGTGLTGYDRRPGIVTLGQQRLTVADLLMQGETSSPTVRYVQEVSYTNAATTVAEGAQKPEASFDLVEVDAAVRKVAVTAKVTDETLEDFAEVRSYIDGRLMFMVEQEEEDQILNGDGVSPNIAGILDFAIQTQPIGTDPMAEAILKAANKVRYVGFAEPDAVVIHPTDWEALMLAQDGNNQYYGGGYFTGAYGNGDYVETPRLWGMRTVVTTAIAAGDPLVGAFKFGGQVFYRNGLSIDATNSNEDDFEKNLITLRAEQRLTVAVYRPLAFCQVITT